MSPNTVAVIQGRMGSSRLPGKVLLEIGGMPMIQRVIERTRRARTLDQVVVATTSNPADDPIADFADSLGIAFSRGSMHDVLDRYYQAAKIQKADIVVRITADCPLVDPQLIDRTVELVRDGWKGESFDFAANRLPPPFSRTYPIGLDVEVCTFAALERAWKESTELFHREHVMPYLYEGANLTRFTTDLCAGVSSRNFRIVQLNNPIDHGSMRWTVDTPEDMEFMRRIFARLDNMDEFSWMDILALVQKEPELSAINADVRHKSMTEVDERAKK
jgi:spore coat polysaccharide biosynthesis protein SpsF